MLTIINKEDTVISVSECWIIIWNASFCVMQMSRKGSIVHCFRLITINSPAFTEIKLLLIMLFFPNIRVSFVLGNT